MKDEYYKDLDENKPEVIIVVDFNRNDDIVDDKFYNKINESYYFSKKIGQYNVFLRKWFIFEKNKIKWKECELKWIRL